MPIAQMISLLRIGFQMCNAFPVPVSLLALLILNSSLIMHRSSTENHSKVRVNI